MLEVGVNGVTDVTGFGLIGHAYEMAEASGVTIELEARKVPLMERTLELARQGVVTRTHKTNLAHLGERFSSTCDDDALTAVLADAQTSGGLLISLPADRADRLIAALKQRNTRAAAVVGRVTPRSDHSVVLS
jgi:selenide,water dikinase